jgi:hypothetical protein
MDAIKQLRLGVIAQMQHAGKVLLYLYTAVIVLMVVVGLLSRVSDSLTLALLMRDPVLSGRLPVGAGIVSQIELVLWSASMTLCLVGWILFARTGKHVRPRRLLLHFGIITMILFMDKMFMFHGDLAPKQLHVDKSIVIAVYSILVLIFVYLNWVEILSSEYLLLALALVMFGASVFLDALPLTGLGVSLFGLQIRFFLEDGSKFAGVATWLAYLWRYTLHRIEPAPVSVSEERTAK